MSDLVGGSRVARPSLVPSRTLGFYLFTVALACAALFAIRDHGSIIAAHATRASGTLAVHGDTRLLMQILLALGAIVISARCAGACCHRFLGQPAVIGEIIAGLAIGPSLLGAVAPGLSAFLFPRTVIAELSTVANIGMILFMFLVGLELDLAQLRRESEGTLLVAHAGILFSLVLGGVLALYLYADYAPAG